MGVIYGGPRDAGSDSFYGPQGVRIHPARPGDFVVYPLVQTGLDPAERLGAFGGFDLRAHGATSSLVAKDNPPAFWLSL